MNLPNYDLQTLRQHVNFVLDVFAEPPYAVLYCEDLLTTTLDKLPSGSNVFIVNVPFFLDCPSSVNSKDSFINLFITEFPYFDFCMIDGQYLIADFKVDYNDALRKF